MFCGLTATTLAASLASTLPAEAPHYGIKSETLPEDFSITPEAFEAIVATLLLGSVGYEPELNSQGERRIWIEAAVADRLTATRRRGERYSDVILRLVEIEA